MKTPSPPNARKTKIILALIWLVLPFLIYQSAVEMVSDSMGAIGFIGILLLFVLPLNLVSLYKAHRLEKQTGSKKWSVPAALVTVLCLTYTFYTPARDGVVNQSKNIFEFLNDQTPWEAGHRKPKSAIGSSKFCVYPRRLAYRSFWPVTATVP